MRRENLVYLLNTTKARLKWLHEWFRLNKTHNGPVLLTGGWKCVNSSTVFRYWYYQGSARCRQRISKFRDFRKIQIAGLTKLKCLNSCEQIQLFLCQCYASIFLCFHTFFSNPANTCVAKRQNHKRQIIRLCVIIQLKALNGDCVYTGACYKVPHLRTTRKSAGRMTAKLSCTNRVRTTCFTVSYEF